MSGFTSRRAVVGVCGSAIAGALALSGCSGSTTVRSSGPASSAPVPAATSATPEAVPSTTAPAGGGTGSSGDTAKAGSHFAIGQPARIPFTYGSTSGTIALTVTSIEQGKAADLDVFHLGAQVKGMVPYYIHYSIKNVGTTDLSSSTVDHVKGLLDDGTEAQDLLTIGQFAKCPSDALPSGFVGGRTATSCAIALAPSASVKVTSAEYWNNPFTLGQGIFWK